jgi:tryptophan-rich sensory protein
MPVSPVLALVGFVGLCLLVGLVGGSMTSHAIPGWYRLLQKPPGTPPGWVFGPVWACLYVMIGVSGWLVWKRIGSSAPLRLWGWQLAANAAWAPAFFGLRRLSLGMAVIVVLLVLIGLTVRSFRRVSRPAALLLLPYLGWCLYAAYLNAGFLLLNHA